MTPRLLTWLLLAEAFASGFYGSLRAQHNLWQMGRTLDRMTREGPAPYGALHQRIWHLWT